MAHEKGLQRKWLEAWIKWNCKRGHAVAVMQRMGNTLRASRHWCQMSGHRPDIAGAWQRW